MGTRSTARPAACACRCGARPKKRLCLESRGGLTYGAATQQSPATWDSPEDIYAPLRLADGFQPADGPVGWVSGVHTANDDFVGGWTGYDCSSAKVPFGDDQRIDDYV